jgi:hypothetical protein
MALAMWPGIAFVGSTVVGLSNFASSAAQVRDEFHTGLERVRLATRCVRAGPGLVLRCPARALSCESSSGLAGQHPMARH